MESEKLFSNIDDFRAELKHKNITKLVFAETKEYRAKQVEEGRLECVMPIVRLELLAYKDAVLYKCSMKDVDLDAVYLMLTEDFEVTRKNRNIT